MPDIAKNCPQSTEKNVWGRGRHVVTCWPLVPSDCAPQEQPYENPFSRTILSSRIVLALAWFALPPTVQAVNRPPDGSYPNENIAEGEDALFSRNGRFQQYGDRFSGTPEQHERKLQAALGANALENITTGSSNTASGVRALENNIDIGNRGRVGDSQTIRIGTRRTTHTST